MNKKASNDTINVQEREVSFRDLVKMPSTTYATFGLYRYPAKFIPQVIAYVLENYSSPGTKVFDPFAGYGTVGIVSKIYGCDYELWDLNPLIETFHEIATLEPKEVNVENLLYKMSNSRKDFIPEWSRIDYWFHQEFLPFLFNIWGFYHSLDDEYLKLILTIPLIKTSRHFSYDDIQRQKLSKSPKSMMRVKSLLALDWKTRFFEMIEFELQKVIKGIQEYSELLPEQTNAIVKGGVDTLNMELKENKDILITSPPYLQSQEYIRQAKMDMFWLGYSEDDARKLGKLEIPYGKVEPKPIYSETYSHYRSKIEQQHLRTVFDRYFWGTLGALTKIQEKVDSYLFLFVGRASISGIPIPIDTIFTEHFTSLDWIHEATLVDDIVARRLFAYKKNPATGREDKRTRKERLLILRKH